MSRATSRALVANPMLPAPPVTIVVLIWLFKIFSLVCNSFKHNPALAARWSSLRCRVGLYETIIVHPEGIVGRTGRLHQSAQPDSAIPMGSCRPARRTGQRREARHSAIAEGKCPVPSWGAVKVTPDRWKLAAKRKLRSIGAGGFEDGAELLGYATDASRHKVPIVSGLPAARS